MTPPPAKPDVVNIFNCSWVSYTDLQAVMEAINSAMSEEEKTDFRGLDGPKRKARESNQCVDSFENDDGLHENLHSTSQAGLVGFFCSPKKGRANLATLIWENRESLRKIQYE